MSAQKPPSKQKSSTEPKKPYVKPTFRSEPLTAVAALCNGVSGGGRKAATPTCNASKLKS